MFNFLLSILLLFIICFACFHIFLALAGGAVFALAGGVWAILVASICLISLGILFIFLWTGFWIFMIGGFIGVWVLISLILFPILLPILLPLLMVFLIISILKQKNDKIRKIP